MVLSKIAEWIRTLISPGANIEELTEAELNEELEAIDNFLKNKNPDMLPVSTLYEEGEDPFDDIDPAAILDLYKE